MIYVGGYAYSLTTRDSWGAAKMTGGWFEKGWGGPSWGPFSSVGAWWAGLAALLAAVISCVADDQIWFVVSCAMNCAACAVCLAGASIDGIYATWSNSLRSCVSWQGTPTYDAAAITRIQRSPRRAFPWWATSGGWRLSGSQAYGVEALMCASNLTSGSLSYVGNNNMVAFDTAYTTPLPLPALPGQTTTTPFAPSNSQIYAGPLWWYQVMLTASGTVANGLSQVLQRLPADGVNGPNGIKQDSFTPPSSQSCFCRWDNTTAIATAATPTSPSNPQVSIPVNFNWDYATQYRLAGQTGGSASSYYPAVAQNGAAQTKDTFNVFTNCFQINIPSYMTCDNVVNQSNTMFGVSCAFCVFCAAITLAAAYYNGMASAWFQEYADEMERKALTKNQGFEATA